MNTDKLANYSYFLTSICWVVRVISITYFSCVIMYDSMSSKMHTILSKKTDYDELEKILIENDSLLYLFKDTYVFCKMYNSLSFRDKLNIKMGSMTWPQVGVSEEIENMSAHEFVILWKKRFNNNG